MGFLDRLENGIDDFLDFSPHAYRRQISDLDEPQLRELHKQIQRKVVGAGAQIVAGGAGALASGGVSLLLSGVGSRRAKVNSQKVDIIEERLRAEGWQGHDFGFRDVIVGAGPAAVASVLAPGVEHVASAMIGHATTHGIAHAAAATATHGTVHGGAHSVASTFDLGKEALHVGTHHAVQSGAAYGIEQWADTTPSTSTYSYHEITEPSKSYSPSPKPGEWSIASKPKANIEPIDARDKKNSVSNPGPIAISLDRRNRLWKLAMVVLNLAMYTVFGNAAVYKCGPIGMILLLWKIGKVAALEPVFFAVLLYITDSFGFVFFSLVRILGLLANGARKHGQPFTGILVTLLIPPLLVLMLSPK